MRIGIDIGGTFTDFVVFPADPTAPPHTFKVLSTPHAPEEAVLQGLRQLRQAEPDLAPQIVHGSTVATNALLEQKGAITALITTAGFGDVLAIGRQNRPDIYDFFSRRPKPLVPADRRLEIRERVSPTGAVLHPLQADDLPPLITQLQQAGVESVAVSLLFSFLHPEHESKIGQALHEAGFFVSLSSQILPEYREYERTSTTVINAFVAPLLERYLSRLERESGAVDFRVIQSNGGSIRAEQARREAVRCVLSGPAGGVVGAKHLAEQAGFSRLMTFDMGGTSTDVSMCDGAVQITTEAEIDGRPIRIPVIDIHTVGAGGGSIAFVDAGGALRVGPQSAGAQPGPVCYAQGGTEPTVTDANLVLGRLGPQNFLGGTMTLNEEGAIAALNELGQAAQLIPPAGLSVAQTAALGVIAIVNAQMERALRVISVQRGHDPRDFTLISFGGAGGLHAVELARSLQMPRVLIPPQAAVLSAFGMLTANVVKDYVQTVMLPGQTDFGDLEARFGPLLAQARHDVTAEGIAPADIELQASLDMRYRGQSYELHIPHHPDFLTAFHRQHQATYGHNNPTAPVEIVNLRLRATGHLSPPPLQPAPLVDSLPEPFARRSVVLADGLQEVPFFAGDDLRAGQALSGPAIIVHPDTTIFLGPADSLAVDAYLNLVVDVGQPTHPEPAEG